MSIEKGQRSEKKANVVATTAKHPDSHSQISRHGWMQPTYMRSVTFLGKFTSSSRSDLLKLPILWQSKSYKLPLFPHKWTLVLSRDFFLSQAKGVL